MHGAFTTTKYDKIFMGDGCRRFYHMELYFNDHVALYCLGTTVTLLL